eukprot:4622097-Alexandrium_andersonii.AAC.1
MPPFTRLSRAAGLHVCKESTKLSSRRCRSGARSAARSAEPSAPASGKRGLRISLAPCRSEG